MSRRELSLRETVPFLIEKLGQVKILVLVLGKHLTVKDGSAILHEDDIQAYY